MTPYSALDFMESKTSTLKVLFLLTFSHVGECCVKTDFDRIVAAFKERLDVELKGAKHVIRLSDTFLVNRNGCECIESFAVKQNAVMIEKCRSECIRARINPVFLTDPHKSGFVIAIERILYLVRVQ